MREPENDPRPESRVASAVGRGAMNAAIFGGLAYGGTKLAQHTGAAEAIAQNGVVQNVATHARNAANHVAQMPGVSNVVERVGNLHLPHDGTQLKSLAGSGRTALMVGGTVAAVTAAVGLVDGWNRASKVRQSWRDRVNSESRAGLMR